MLVNEKNMQARFEKPTAFFLKHIENPNQHQRLSFLRKLFTTKSHLLLSRKPPFFDRVLNTPVSLQISL